MGKPVAGARGATWRFGAAARRAMTQEGLRPGQIGVHRWFLRHDRPCPAALPVVAGQERRPGLHCALHPRADGALLRWLYVTVGTPWLWYEALDQPMSLWHALGQDAYQPVLLLRDGEAIAGYCLLDARSPARTQISNFGLVPRHTGRGHGRALLQTALAAARHMRPRAPVWLHTCTLDSPRALANYRGRGFWIVGEDRYIIDDPRLDGRAPKTASPHIPLAQ